MQNYIKNILTFCKQNNLKIKINNIWQNYVFAINIKNKNIYIAQIGKYLYILNKDYAYKNIKYNISELSTIIEDACWYYNISL